MSVTQTDPEEEFTELPLVFVPRNEWEADPPVKTTPMTHPVHKVVFTFDTEVGVCRNKEECIMAMQVLQGRHMTIEGRDDIKYNFLVGGDGLVYEGRGYHNQPDDTLQYPEHNGDRLDIAYIGNFRNYDAVPKKLILVGYDTAQKGIDDGYVADFYEYYESKSTSPELPLISFDEFYEQQREIKAKAAAEEIKQ